MAGDWLKMEASTPEKPEVLSITARMGWDDPDLTVGKLFRVWRWFDQQTTDGNAKNVTHALLDRIAGVSGFAKAMELEGWLLVLDDGVSLPNFTKHNGATAKNRSETARRVAKHRAKHDGDAGQYVRLTLPRPIREAVLARDGRQCVYCSRKEGEYTATETKTAGVLHVDNVIPVCRGGSDELCNLATACSTCNMFKGDRTPDECGFVWPVGADGKRLGNEKNVTAPLAREEKRREESNTPQPPKGRTEAVGLKAWAKAVKAKGEKLIPEDDPIFAYAEKVGLQSEFLDLAWPAFRHRYTVQHPAKRYTDWRRVFRNAVEGNWLKLWYADQNGEYRLTTSGIQAQRALAEAA